jgi:signal peptidase I
VEFLFRKIRIVVVIVLLLIAIRFFIEGRIIPSISMEPSIKINDRVLIEKVSTIFRHYNHGEIVIFYPPPIEMGGNDLSWDPMHVLGRLTGLPFFPYEPAFIKRVIGLPGDTIRVQAGQGVFLNGKLLDESYVSEATNYTINTLHDIGGRSSTGAIIQPYANDLDAPIVVQPGQLFVMGDNRNNSEDSHIYGMIDQNRVIGRAFVQYLPAFKSIELPSYR